MESVPDIPCYQINPSIYLKPVDYVSKHDFYQSLMYRNCFFRLTPHKFYVAVALRCKTFVLEYNRNFVIIDEKGYDAFKAVCKYVGDIEKFSTPQDFSAEEGMVKMSGHYACATMLLSLQWREVVPWAKNVYIKTEGDFLLICISLPHSTLAYVLSLPKSLFRKISRFHDTEEPATTTTYNKLSMAFHAKTPIDEIFPSLTSP
jgi:hypothetical protein